MVVVSTFTPGMEFVSLLTHYAPVVKFIDNKSAKTD